ncbi:MAG TPA: PaaI family thioesterase [Acidimicrobiia bacterium]|nr:PaaI family thioesterase [Acidimicrobiia bacterium]
MDGFRFLTGDVIPVPELEVRSDLPTQHLPWCFGCGSENEQGLGVWPRYEGDKVTGALEFAKRFQGGPGVVHGGAAAAFFDDLMGFVMIAHQQPAVTAKLEMNYLRPIPLGLTLRAEAWLAAQDGRKLWAEAVGFDERGTRYVEARALFIPIGVDHFAGTLQHMDPHHLARMSRFDSEEYYP